MGLFSFFRKKRNKNYKIYTALLTQNGENSPNVDILKNTIGNINWIRDNAGNFTGKRLGGFPIEKTFLMVNHGVPGAAEFVLIHNHNNGTLRLSTRTQNHQPIDGLLDYTSVEIRIYD